MIRPQWRNQRPRLVMALGASAVMVYGCSGGTASTTPRDDQPAPPVPASTRIDFGGGTVTSFVSKDAAGTPITLGIRLSRGVITGVGSVHLSAILELPRDADLSPFNHIQLDWMPSGHAPDGIYFLPHFDAHFFMIGQADRAAITLADRTAMFRQPQERTIPAGYRADSEGFAGMGVHWLDSQAPEFAQQPFTRTMIHGFHDGRMIFQEPMVTKAFLETRPDFRAPVAQPREYSRPGFYPTTYHIAYDAATGDYIIALDGLTRR